MEQEQIIERLRGEIGETSLSDRTITEYVSLNLPTDGGEPDDAYFTKHAGVLKSLSGNFNHDVSVAVEDFKKKWKPAPDPKVNPKVEPKPDPNGGGDEGISKILKAMQSYQEKVEQLEKKLNETEKSKAYDALLSKVRVKMQEQGAKDQYVLDKALAGADFGDETNIDVLTKQMLEKYDAEYTACRGKGISPRNAGNGGGGGASKELDDFFTRKAKRERWGNGNKQ